MNRSTKIVLLVLASLLGLCLLAMVVSVVLAGTFMARVAHTQPAQVAASAQRVARYTLPAGYSESFSIDIAGVTAIGISGSDGHSHIYLAKLPAGISLDKLDLERKFASQGQSRPYNSRERVQPRQVGTLHRTIRGQQINMVISEGTNSEQQPYRELSGAYAGRLGTTVLQITSPLSTWDQDAFDAFIASIN